MNTKNMTNEELAKQFIVNCAANLPNDAEREELERRGLDHITIESSCSELTESAIERMDEAELDEAIDEAAQELAEELNRKSDVHEVYEIWIVENGSLAEFGRGWALKPTATANMCWGSYDTIDEVRARFRELADENYNRECGPCESADDPETECAKYVEDCAKSLCIEWHNDLKWVRCRKMLEDDNGDRTFVEVI